MTKETCSDEEKTAPKPSLWKAWRPLWITLIVLAVGISISVWRIVTFIHCTQPNVWGCCWSPDGKAYATSYEDGSVWITSFDAKGNTNSRALVPRPLGRWDVPDRIFLRLFWSPNGKYIAGYAYKYFYIWDVETGKETRGPVLTEYQSHVVWNAESTHLSYLAFPYPLKVTSGNFTITSFPALDEGPTKSVTVSDLNIDLGAGRSKSRGFYREPVWTSDLKKVAVFLPVDKGDETAICIIDAASGTVLSKWEFNYKIKCMRWSPDGNRIATVKSTVAPEEFAVIDVRDVNNDGKVLQSLVVRKSLVENPTDPEFRSDWEGLKWSEDGKRIGFASCCLFSSNSFSAATRFKVCLITWWDVESEKLIAHCKRDIRNLDSPTMLRLYLQQPVWSRDLEALVVPIHHISLLALLGPGQGYPTSKYSSYGDFSTIAIDRAPASVPRSLPLQVAK